MTLFHVTHVVFFAQNLLYFSTNFEFERNVMIWNSPIWFSTMTNPMESVSLPWDTFENPTPKQSVTHSNRTKIFEIYVVKIVIVVENITKIGHH